MLYLYLFQYTCGTDNYKVTWWNSECTCLPTGLQTWITLQDPMSHTKSHTHQSQPLPTRSPVFIVYLFPGASTVVRSPSAGSKMIGRRGWRLWAVDLVGLLVMAVMVEETLELKLSHHLHGDMGEIVCSSLI